MVNTDPPYGVAYQSDKFADIANDDLTGDTLQNFLIQNFKLLHKHTIENPALYVYHASRTQTIFEDALNIAGFKVKQQIIWVKNMFAFGRSDYHWKHEPLFYAVKEEKNCEWFGDRTQTTLLDDRPDFEEMEKDDLIEYIEKLIETSTTFEVAKDNGASYQHPTTKPVKLAQIAIRNSSQPGEIVLEPFSGSGSTLIGGFTTGRKVYAIEFEPKYVQVAIQRMVEFSGEEMIEINGEMVNWYEYKENK
jgi:DNA modification methylase